MREKVYVFGNDYNTQDGTGVRDYIHVVDLAYAHVKALDIARQSRKLILNIGTGRGYSVLEVLKTFEKVIGMNVPYIIASRRQGDVAECYASPHLANDELQWRAKYDLEDMCRDQWRWQNK